MKKTSKERGAEEDKPDCVIRHALRTGLCFCVLHHVCSRASHLGDDLDYSFLAHYFASGSFVQSASDIFSVRILHVIPIGIMYEIFGYGVLSSSAWDTICFLMTIALTFLIGRELCNEYVGAIAALLLAFLPMAGILAVTMSDNVSMMFFASLSMFALLRDRRAIQESGTWHPESRWRLCL